MKLSSLNLILKQNRVYISGILLANSMLLWFLTIAVTKINEFAPDTLYYAKQLPLFYWIGMGLNCLTILSLINTQNLSDRMIWLLRSLMIIVLILYIFGTPLFLYDNPTPNDAVGYGEVVGTLDNTGYTEGDELLQGYVHYVTEFPGATVYASMVVKITDISSLTFEKYSSLFIISILCLFIYALAKMISPRYALFAPVAYLSCAFIYGYHFCPQILGLVLTAGILLLLITAIREQEVNQSSKVKIFALIMLLWGAIIISHMSTPIINLWAFAIIFALSIFFLRYRPRFLTERISQLSGVLRKTRGIYGAFLIIFLITYALYIVIVGDFLIDKISGLIGDVANDVTQGNMFRVTDRSVESETSVSYVLFYKARWLGIIGMLIFGFTSIIVNFRVPRHRISNFLFASLFLGYVSLGVALVIAGDSAAFYGPDRAYMFAIIPCSILFSLVLVAKLGKLTQLIKTLLFIIIFAFAISVPLTRYGNLPYNFTSNSELAGIHFAAKHPEMETNVKGFDSFLMGFSPFTNYGYNWYKLKQQEGYEYAVSYTGQHKIYDSGQCRVYER